MIAPDHDRGLYFSLSHQLVEGKACFFAVALAEPADAGRQPLKSNALAGHFDPAGKTLVLRKQIQYHLISGVNIFRVTGKRYPAERALALAEQRTDIGRNEAREIKGVFYSALVMRLATQVISIIKRYRSPA